MFDVGGTNITSAGGAGGSVGATGSTGVAASITGGTGGAGQAESGGSIVGGGGGGGGAGVYINDASSAPIIGSTTTLAGGMGGMGGDAMASIANGNATNGDPGAGGGGGAGVIIASGAGGVSLINNGRILGGAGGNGGNGGYAGSGGGGGDGLLVLGVGSAITNNTTGSIIGGLGGNPGIYQDGGNLPGGYGGGGAGVNLVGAGSSLENAGTILGGNALTASSTPSAQDGQPGVGVRGWGGTTVITDGTIAGGNNGNVQADSVLFSGGDNQIVILSGASFTGNIQSISGSTNGGDIFTLAGDVNGSLNAGLINGFTTDTKTGNSNWTLTGTGNAGINWTIQQGELTGNSSTFDGSLTFVGNGIGTPAVDFNQTTTGSYAGSISGAGNLIKDGTGSLTLAGNLSTFSGPFTINQGTVMLTGNGNLQGADVSDAGTLDVSGTSGTTATVDRISGSGVVTLGSHTLAINSAAGDNFSGVIGGTGSVVLNGGTQTFSGNNTYVGGTAINAGTLTLDGNNDTSTGPTTVASGAMLIVGDSSHATATAGGDVSVSDGTLSGFGTVQGSVTLSGGAAMTPGTALAAGTLTVGGDLNIGTGSNLNFDFGAPGPNFSTPGQSDHVVVNGNLAIASSTLNASNLGSMGPGLYNLFTWGGALTITGGGFAPPSGMSLQILTATKQINLVDTQGLTLDEWDADGLASATQMGGGSGTWSVSSNTWSDTNGQHVGPMSPQPGFAIFGGAAGTVTVDDSGGQVGVTGMQFASDGYHLTGGAIDLVGQGGVAPVLRVSSGATATIDNELDGTSGLNKTDGGTLVLTGSNPYTGTTTLSGGYLSVSSDANLGAAADPLDFEGGTLEITGTTFNQTARTMIWGSAGGGFDIDASANTFTVTQTLGGSGGLLKSGAGTLTLTGANTFTGGTAVAAGTLAVGNDQALGTGTVDMAAGTTLSFAATGLSLANAFALNGDPTFDVASGQTDTVSGVI
ncbi:MAG TPA: autotransporter-associated beta strand repeat-containing protein, partial [Rhodanobacteraceae bacterium]|nr:autotransporter-associated beta strand repeat-containing protein [Rhodanobacteraceae bacterium]